MSNDSNKTSEQENLMCSNEDSIQDKYNKYFNTLFFFQFFFNSFTNISEERNK